MMIKDRKEKERADEEGEIESRTRQREIRIDLVKKKSTLGCHFSVCRASLPQKRAAIPLFAT